MVRVVCMQCGKVCYPSKKDIAENPVLKAFCGKSCYKVFDDELW